MTPVSRDKRRESGAQSRDRILSAAKRLISRHGAAGVSLRDVTDAANVNIASVSYHFGSKDVLFRAAVDEALRTIARSHERSLRALPVRAGTTDIAGALVRTVVSYLCSTDEEKRMLAVLSARALLSPEDDAYESVTAGLFEALHERLRVALPALAEREVLFRARAATLLLRGIAAGVIGFELDGLSARSMTLLFVPVVAGVLSGESVC